MRYKFAADSFYIMKLCGRLFVLYCRSRPKYDTSRHFDPHFVEVRGDVEPWLMARWKARAEFFLSVIELLFLSLGSVTARHSSSGRQSNFAALNRGRHLYSAGRPYHGGHWLTF